MGIQQENLLARSERSVQTDVDFLDQLAPSLHVAAHRFTELLRRWFWQFGEIQVAQSLLDSRHIGDGIYGLVELVDDGRICLRGNKDSVPSSNVERITRRRETGDIGERRKGLDTAVRDRTHATRLHQFQRAGDI